MPITEDKYLRADDANFMKSVFIQSLLLMTITLAFFGSLSAQNRSGTYFRSDDYGRGDITFKELGRGRKRRLNFYLSIAGARRGTCIGDHRGKAKWIDSNIAEYNGDFNEVNSDRGPIGCRLTFVFAGNRVTIRETNCDDYHGMVCQFEGVYTLKRKTK